MLDAPEETPDLPELDLTALTDVQRRRVELALSGQSATAIAKEQGVHPKRVRESLLRAERTIPHLAERLKLAGVHSSRYTGRLRERVREATAPTVRPCVICGRDMTCKRPERMYCSSACKDKGWRRRHAQD